MRLTTILGWAVLGAALAGARPAQAFDALGHAAIERRAYYLIGQRPDGHAILQALYEQRVLKEAPGQLAPHSTYPDLSLERQLAQDRQVYHFMAPNKPAVHAARLTGADRVTQQRRLLVEALPDCMRLMYLFFQETLRNSVGSSEAGRGVYVLMHVVADSYSHEHTTRDPATQQLLTVKAWRLSRFGWPAAAKAPEPAYPGSHTVTMALLHRVKHAEADHEWLADTGCLNAQAESAAAAVAELLITIYQAQQLPGGPAPTNATDQLWSAYVQRHFKPLHSEVHGDTFVYPAPLGGNAIPFMFRAEYDNSYRPTPVAGPAPASPVPALDIFSFDRFPMRTWYAVALGKAHRYGYGFEMNWHTTPGGVDEKNALVNGIPWGGAFAATVIPRRREAGADLLRQAGNTLQLKALFAPNLLLIPKLNGTLQPRIGVSGAPFAAQKSIGGVFGFDMAWGLFPDIVVRGFHYTSRLAVGYQYDTAGLPAYHSLALKIGFNSWKGRVIKAPKD